MRFTLLLCQDTSIHIILNNILNIILLIWLSDYIYTYIAMVVEKVLNTDLFVLEAPEKMFIRQLDTFQRRLNNQA